MRKLGIIQPGKIGDIIICLPIAKWYYDRGYEIVWPIDATIMSHFVEHIDYVKFIPTLFDCDSARRICTDESCNTVIDVSFTIPNGNALNTHHYLNQCEMEFDELKYKIANVPFDEKWKLHLNRNLDREISLYNTVVTAKTHIVVQWNGSNCSRQVRLDNPNNHQVVEVQPITSSVFDWIHTLERASFLVLIDSSIANLVEQLGMPQTKYLLTRQKAKPTLRNDWIVVT